MANRPEHYNVTSPHNRLRKGFIYEVIEKETKKTAYKGVLSQIQSYLGVDCRSTLTSAVRKNTAVKSHYVNKHYYIRNTGILYSSVETKKEAKKLSKLEEQYKTVKWCLDIYGNTIIFPIRNEKKILEKLEKNGYICQVEVFPQTKDHIITLLEKKEVPECNG